MASVSCSLLNLPSKMKNLTLTSSSNSGSLSFSRNISQSRVLSQGTFSLNTVQRRGVVVVCEAAPKKVDSAIKKALQAERRRVYNKARKSEIRTRTKKVLEALELLKKKSDAQAEEITSIEKMIGEAYSIIDKAVKVGTLHRNTGANRKSRLARRKKAVEIHHGWYAPVPQASV
ncbi:putative ribosomal protein S20 [Medicago truncatula]|uniref:Small ribosomal subunit protein bS20c n=1 Tax=Medicago truncatula TaxID=3880 RepID=G7LDS2_MEDTR|nr:30S ribosomal protein S20, chloroplastic [Medicago truncatula]AET03030.1 30S ribosomal protein S20 [Medicago truncatula]RHN40916.1 putative ribosomal protein S20 [Medicago truncatula]